jgi:hypothetical protein
MRLEPSLELLTDESAIAPKGRATPESKGGLEMRKPRIAAMVTDSGISRIAQEAEGRPNSVVKALDWRSQAHGRSSAAFRQRQASTR